MMTVKSGGTVVLDFLTIIVKKIGQKKILYIRRDATKNAKSGKNT